MRTWIASFVAIALLASCSSKSDGTEPENSGSRGEVLAHLGEDVISAKLVAFTAKATNLENAVKALNENYDQAKLATAQQAWREAMLLWQQIEVMQVGPIAVNEAGVIAGEDKRDGIYAWPQLSLCSVDQKTAGDSLESDDEIATTISVSGLGAIEYLLFASDFSHHCSALSDFGSSGKWEKLSEADISSRRAKHAQTLARVVVKNANALNERFDKDGGNFIEEFNSPSRSGAIYGNAQEGLNAVSDAMTYLDKETKDSKLGDVLGLSDICEADACPENRESIFANHSIENIGANLRGFRVLYLGGENDSGQGFDDLLIELDSAEFAASMLAHIDDAIAAADELQGKTIESALQNDRDKLVALHTAISQVSQDFKTMFLSILNLQLPDGAAGDTDG